MSVDEKTNRRQPSKRNTSGLRRGGPGRQPGVPNKVTQEVKTFAQQIVGDEAYRDRFLKRLRAGKLPARLEEMLWHYAYGKPKQAIEVAGKVTLEDVLDASYRPEARERAGLPPAGDTGDRIEI